MTGPLNRVGDTWLCVAHGETDRPCVVLAKDRAAVEGFIVDQWLGDAADPDLPEIMATFDAHDWSDGTLEWEFEIGGIEIRDVYSSADSPAQEDTARLDWMEKNLCRVGEVRDKAGRCVKLARVWSIMGELETLRETVDAAIRAGGDKHAKGVR